MDRLKETVAEYIERHVGAMFAEHRLLGASVGCAVRGDGVSPSNSMCQPN